MLHLKLMTYYIPDFYIIENTLIPLCLFVIRHRISFVWQNTVSNGCFTLV